MGKKILFALFVLLVTMQNSFASPRTGVFLWPSTLCEYKQVDDMVNLLKNNGITDVFVLVKGEAGATYYPSEYTYADYFYQQYLKEKSKEKKEKYFHYYNYLKDSLLLHKFVTAAHKRQIKVHAWFIVSGDQYFIKKNPGAEVVHLQDNKVSKYPYPLIDHIHVNLSYPGYKEYFLNHVRKALRIPFDGIMLDKIRYTHLSYTWDNIHTSKAMRLGVSLDKIFDLAYKTVYGTEDDKEKFVYAYRDGDRDVTQWIKLKKEDIETYVKETEKIAREKNLEFSAAFMPEGAYDPNFADVYYAQNYHDLSRYFDFIVIMAYAKAFEKPATWLKMVVKNAQIRSSCKIWAAIQGYSDVSTEMVYEQTVNARIAQPDGIAIFRFGSMGKERWQAYNKGMREKIDEKIKNQIYGIIFTGGGTIRNCWLKSADAALLSEKIIPLLFNEAYLQKDDFFKKTEFVLIPGGGGSSVAEALGEEGLRNIERFVAGGGGYLGVCAGAYLPIKGYWDNLTTKLQLVNAEAVDIDHWNRGSGKVELKIVNQHPIFEGEENPFFLNYYSGPVLKPSDLSLPPYKELAIFKTDIHENGAKPGEMLNKTAILEAVYKKGKIILFSPHPELTPGKEKMLTRAMLYVSQRKQSGR
ncbi:BPL-N domain-containing protein [Calditrichota bacterium GD2]